MQKELGASHPDLNIQLVGVNAFGKESGVPEAIDGRDIPLLQDVDADNDGDSDAWDLWNANWRDVFILDANNNQVDTFNLFTYDLSKPEDYGTLRTMLLDAATEDKPWQNPANPLDVNNDTLVTPVGDVLPIVNELNERLVSDEEGRLPASPESSNAQLYLDVNGDNYVTPAGDVLPVINFLNIEADGEGEKAGDNDAVSTDAPPNVLPSSMTQILAVAVGNSRATDTTFRTTNLSSGTVDSPKLQPNVNRVGVVPLIPAEDVLLATPIATVGSKGELDLLEPLLVDLAEDLTKVWYGDVGGVF